MEITAWVVTPPELSAVLRTERNRFPDTCDKLVLRYRNQPDASLPTTWTAERYHAELIYMRAEGYAGGDVDPANPVSPGE